MTESNELTLDVLDERITNLESSAREMRRGITGLTENKELVNQALEDLRADKDLLQQQVDSMKAQLASLTSGVPEKGTIL